MSQSNLFIDIGNSAVKWRTHKTEVFSQNIDTFSLKLLPKVDKIWVTFPDPYPKPCKANKRLISPRFIELYKKVLKPGGTVHFKTDNTKLFEYSLEHIRPHRVIRDLHASDAEENLKIKTFYWGDLFIMI